MSDCHTLLKKKVFPLVSKLDLLKIQSETKLIVQSNNTSDFVATMNFEKVSFLKFIFKRGEKLYGYWAIPIYKGTPPRKTGFQGQTMKNLIGHLLKIPI